MPKTITFAQLAKHGACQDQLDLFRKSFGERVTVSHELVPQALALKFQIGWAAESLLTLHAREAYRTVVDQADKAYRTAMIQALYVDNADMAPVYSAINAAIAQALDIHAATITQAEAVYSMATAQALVVFDTARAHAFVDAYLSN